ncbi:GDP-L-galactose phosphorylase 1-like [Canna indica]|uniref:GDP-L-galactose phosphorylase 1-like n=1 Tax=Canna indica TaxID=4628 RepID=A0AAQ3K210_9LILI|nr:GDP-L-galactose phosphorylase 1-like [Canna indica]
MTMAPVEPVEGEFTFLKQNMRSEQSKSHQVPPQCIITNVYQLGIPTKTDGVLGNLPCSEAGSPSLLDIILLSQWEDHAWKGQLRFDVTACQKKVVTGGRKFIAQLNENWKPSILMDLEKQTIQSLRPTKLSDVKHQRENVLVCVSFGERECPELVSSTMLPKDGILIIANAHPIEYGHAFLVPYDVHQMPWLLDKKVLGLMMQITAEVANCSFRVFFDYDASISLDQKCFQASYFADPLPVELLPTIPVYGNLLTSGVYISEVADYALKTLIFVSKNLKALVEVVGEMCSYLHDNGTAFSLLISDCGTKVFMFPQVRAILGYQLSTLECGGYFVYDTKSDFDHINEADILKLLASVSLDVPNFETLKQQCCVAASKLVL